MKKANNNNNKKRKENKDNHSINLIKENIDEFDMIYNTLTKKVSDYIKSYSELNLSEFKFTNEHFDKLMSLLYECIKEYSYYYAYCEDTDTLTVFSYNVFDMIPILTLDLTDIEFRYREKYYDRKFHICFTEDEINTKEFLDKFDSIIKCLGIQVLSCKVYSFMFNRFEIDEAYRRAKGICTIVEDRYDHCDFVNGYNVYDEYDNNILSICRDDLIYEKYINGKYDKVNFFCNIKEINKEDKKENETMNNKMNDSIKARLVEVVKDYFNSYLSDVDYKYIIDYVCDNYYRHDDNVRRYEVYDKNDIIILSIDYFDKRLVFINNDTNIKDKYISGKLSEKYIHRQINLGIGGGIVFTWERTEIEEPKETKKVNKSKNSIIIDKIINNILDDKKLSCLSDRIRKEYISKALDNITSITKDITGDYTYIGYDEFGNCIFTISKNEIWIKLINEKCIYTIRVSKSDIFFYESVKRITNVTQNGDIYWIENTTDGVTKMYFNDVLIEEKNKETETIITYHKNGQIKSHKIGDNDTQYYEYDTAGLVSCITDRKARPNKIEYKYDENNIKVSGNVYEDGKLVIIAYFDKLNGSLIREMPVDGSNTKYYTGSSELLTLDEISRLY